MRKCGFHVQQTSSELRQAIEIVQPTLCVSLAHDADFWRGVKAEFPEIFLIGRLFEIREGFSEDWRQVDPCRWAEECAGTGMCYDAWITRNEPDGITNEITSDDAKRHDEWLCAFRERALALGFEAVGPNVPAGNWHGANVVDYLPEWCKSARYISLHCYSARAMWDQAPALERAPEDVPQTDGEERGWWYCGRYRGWHRAICERYPWRDGQFEMVITEGGVAYGVIPGPDGTPRYGDVGWQHDLTEEQYLASVDWYTRLLNEDNYCLGWAIFMVGAADPKWNSFETLPLCPRLVDMPGMVEVKPPQEEEMVIKIYDFEHGPGDESAPLKDWSWLESVFGDIDLVPIYEQCSPEPGDVVYVLEYLDARVGDANVIIHVAGLDGEPVEGVSTVFGWPDAGKHGLPEKPSNWTDHGVVGLTNAEGDNGPGYGPGAYYDPKTEKGPHFVWIWDAPSEKVTGLGMLPGGEPEPGVFGNHAHLNVGYRAVIWKGAPEPTPEPTPEPEPGEPGEALDIVAEMEADLGRLREILQQIDDLV